MVINRFAKAQQDQQLKRKGHQAHNSGIWRIDKRMTKVNWKEQQLKSETKTNKGRLRGLTSGFQGLATCHSFQQNITQQIEKTITITTTIIIITTFSSE